MRKRMNELVLNINMAFVVSSLFCFPSHHCLIRHHPPTPPHFSSLRYSYTWTSSTMKFFFVLFAMAVVVTSALHTVPTLNDSAM